MEHLSILADNLKHIRLQRGLTLSGLAQHCGIAKSTLSRLETGQGNPTIDTLWALADALGVPFGHLVVGDESGLSAPNEFNDQGAVVRLIERHLGNPVVETYRMEISAGHIRRSAPHAPGVSERVVVLKGSMLIGSSERPQRLNTGESCEFAADVEHLYGAIDEPAVGMVFIEYPAQASHYQLADQTLDWPDTPQHWEVARSIFQRVAIETATGIAGTLLRLRHAPESNESLRQLIAEYTGVGTTNAWPIFSMAGRDEHGAFWAALPLSTTSAFVGDPLEEGGDVLIEAKWLSRLAETPFLPDAVGVAEKNHGSQKLILDCLASEVSLQRGVVRLPSKLTDGEATPDRHLAFLEGEGFSSRIDVDHYATYEFLHPAYARQVVAMAEDVFAFGGDAASGEAIDIGSGPGAALLMLTELLPGLGVTAIEPDSVAIAHLRAATEELPRIKWYFGDFLDIEVGASSQKLLTSVGASHHLNTPLMLRKCQSLLEPGGLLCIADEFLPEFHDRQTRLRSLILHHGSYILTSAANLDRSDPTAHSPSSMSEYDDIRQSLCLAVLEAQRSFINEAVIRCRGLLSRLNRQESNTLAGCPLDAHVRFFRLEMQAMVAGFDYEVERKTYARRFLEMARLNGFELLQHRRVFATSGADDWQGGTHVFAFRKLSVSL